MTSDILSVAKAEEQRLEARTQRLDALLSQNSEKLQAIRRVIELYDAPEQAMEQQQEEQSREPAIEAPLAEPNGRYGGGSQSAAIRAGAAEYLRQKGGPASGAEIYRALLAMGITIPAKRPLSVVTSRLSHSPMFLNTGLGYQLAERRP